MVPFMHMKTSVAAILSLWVVASPALAREQIRVVGSSTVYPFVTVAAEQFGQDGLFKTPIVESTGTGGGLKLFCEGVGVRTPDLSNASRQITESEIELCRKNGVTDIAEITLGYDGIVMAQKNNGKPLNFTRRQIFLALARELPGKDGALVTNPYKKWSDIDASLPDAPIQVYGPPPTSGTRDAFVELVMEKGCEQVSGFAAIYPDKKKRQKACHLIREDGAFIESGEDDNVIVQKLTANDKAMGVVGYSFFEENSTKIMASKIEGVLPNYDSIESKQYTVSRSLFVYVKKQHIGTVPGIAEFIREMTGESALGPEGYMTVKGLLPLGEKERKAMRAVAAGL